MTTNAIEVGELLYEVVIRFTAVTEYGASLDALASGTAPPPEGARVDFAFEGDLCGPRLSAQIAGVDYARIRADGRFELHIHAQIRTADGTNIAFFGEGTATPEPGTPRFRIHETVSFHCSSPAYAWLNQVQGWGQGLAELDKGQVRIKVYAVT